MTRAPPPLPPPPRSTRAVHRMCPFPSLSSSSLGAMTVVCGIMRSSVVHSSMLCSDGCIATGNNNSFRLRTAQHNRPAHVASPRPLSAISPLPLVLPPDASLLAAPGDAAAMDVDGSDTDKDALEKMVCCCTLACFSCFGHVPPSLLPLSQRQHLARLAAVDYASCSRSPLTLSLIFVARARCSGDCGGGRR
jgi:hypothetical protein